MKKKETHGIRIKFSSYRSGLFPGTAAPQWRWCLCVCVSRPLRVVGCCVHSKGDTEKTLIGAVRYVSH